MPSPLHGLNVVYLPPRLTTTPTQDLLASPPDFPGLTNQTDLWTDLSFASDEPPIDTHTRERESEADSNLLEIDERSEMDRTTQQHRLIMHLDKKHQPAPVDTSTQSVVATDNQSSPHPQGPFDLTSFLAGFGIDPFLVPPQPESDYSSLSSLSQSSLSSISAVGDIAQHSLSQADGEAQPASKRSRTGKNLIISQAPVVVPALRQAEPSSARAASELSDDHDPLTTPLTPAEDKRRRNTAASARFRAKKKEREQALERRSKDLETRVNELERECEGLRRENGWLKGLVIGVTGGNPSKGVVEDEAVGQEANHKRKRETNIGVVDS